MLQHFKYGKEIVQTTTTYIGLYGLPSCNRLMRYYELACIKASVAGKISWAEGSVRVRVPLALQSIIN